MLTLYDGLWGDGALLPAAADGLRQVQVYFYVPADVQGGMANGTMMGGAQGCMAMEKQCF